MPQKKCCATCKYFHPRPTAKRGVDIGVCCPLNIKWPCWVEVTIDYVAKDDGENCQAWTPKEKV